MDGGLVARQSPGGGGFPRKVFETQHLGLDFDVQSLENKGSGTVQGMHSRKVGSGALARAHN